jgi:hypothetical protein
MVDQADSFHFVTVGTTPALVSALWSRIAAKGNYRISHIIHPSFDRKSWAEGASAKNIHFLCEDLPTPMPVADRDLLAALERDDVPTIHNMILSDRFVSKLAYEDVLPYATYLVRRLVELYRDTRPSLVIGGFDALHGSLAFAVAKQLNIPWCALNFSSIPIGEVAICTDLGPASRIALLAPSRGMLQLRAENLLRGFEERKIHAAASIPPKLFSSSFILLQIPAQIRALFKVARRRRLKETVRFTDKCNAYSIRGLFKEAFRLRRNIWQLHRQQLLAAPGQDKYVFFGLHTQPESSIDVFAHFFSDQVRVIELIARSIPPSHRLMIKLHKSDTLNYSVGYLAELSRLPGVELVSPYADTYEFIRNADLIFSIQGTIGLEGALLGKPVLMFGDSPTKIFPSVSTIGKTTDLPRLVRQKLQETPPSRAQIVEAFMSYLAPFVPASSNDWSMAPTDAEIDAYVQLFAALAEYFEHSESRSRV